MRKCFFKILLVELFYFITLHKLDICRKKSPENKLDSNNDRDRSINNVRIYLQPYQNKYYVKI
jgi:hypothetical protein